MTILECIANEFKDAVRKRCSDTGCTLKLNDLEEHIVLKGEAVYKKQPVCDCIIFAKHENLCVGVVELKSKTVDISKVIPQLTNGLKFAFDAFNQCGSGNERFKCYVVVLAKKWRTSEHKIIKSKKINFQGKKYNILPKRCGDSFAAIISKVGFL